MLLKWVAYRTGRDEVVAEISEKIACKRKYINYGCSNFGSSAHYSISALVFSLILCYNIKEKGVSFL